ncbi:hypothetical protein GCM10022293_42050 [Azospirillum formosense]
MTVPVDPDPPPAVTPETPVTPVQPVVPTVIDVSQSYFTQADSQARGETITFAGGKLLATATATLTQPVTIQASGGTIDANGNTVTLSGTLTNAGQLTIADTAGGGEVAINGVLRGGTLYVQPNSVLRGTGLIAAPGTILGTLRPGNSPGTLTFGASQTLGNGASLVLDIDGTGTGTGAGNYSRVIVLGTGNSFTVGSGTTIAPQLRGLTGSANNSYNPAMGTRFANVVFAEGGINGSFARLTQPGSGLLPGTRFDTVYNANATGTTSAVDLYVTPTSYGNLAATGTSQTRNQAAAGAAIDAIRPAAGTKPTGDVKTVFDALYPLGAPDVTVALDQVSGVIHADAAAADLGTRRRFGDVVASRQAALRERPDSVTRVSQKALSGFQLVADGQGAKAAGGTAGNDPAANGSGLAAGNAQAGWSTWARAFGAFSDTNGDGSAAGFSTRGGGAMVGIDREVLSGFNLGMGFGYARTEVKARDGGGRTEADSYQAVLYGGWTNDALFVDGNVGYAFNHYDSKRGISFGSLNRTAVADYNGNDLSAALTTGYRLKFDAYNVEPSVGIRWDHITRNSFTETGANALNLSADDLSKNAVRSSIGARVWRGFATEGGMKLEPELRARWDHEFLDDAVTSTASLGGAGFTVQSPRTGRDAAVLGAGIAAVLDSSLKFYADYDATLSDNTTAHAVTAGFKLTW